MRQSTVATLAAMTVPARSQGQRVRHFFTGGASTLLDWIGALVGVDSPDRMRNAVSEGRTDIIASLFLGKQNTGRIGALGEDADQRHKGDDDGSHDEIGVGCREHVHLLRHCLGETFKASRKLCWI